MAARPPGARCARRASCTDQGGWYVTIDLYCVISYCILFLYIIYITNRSLYVIISGLSDRELAALQTWWTGTCCTRARLVFYTRFRNQSRQESIHRVLLKFAPKLKFFRQTMDARIAMCVLHWNENVDRPVLRVRRRAPSEGKSRGKYHIDQGPPTLRWREQLALSVFKGI